jgi:hypothetical protein
MEEPHPDEVLPYYSQYIGSLLEQERMPHNNSLHLTIAQLCGVSCSGLVQIL